MATTAQTIVTRALKHIGAIEAGETPSNEDAQDALGYLNNMLHGWEKLRVPNFSHTTLELGDNFALDDSWIEGVEFNLAVRLANEWGYPVPDWVARIATATFQAFQLRRADQEDAADPTAGTAQNVIARAFRLCGLLRPGEKPATHDETGALTMLNEMLHGWAKKGVDIQHADLALTDEIKMHESWLEGIRYNLAVQIADEYPEAVVKPNVIEKAREYFLLFQAHTFEFDDFLAVDRALQPRFFNRRLGGYDINES